MNEVTEGKMVRGSDGQFIEGASGNPLGRPKGSKNKVTLYKLQAEEAFRERNQTRIDAVLDLIVQAALDGDKAAMKMVWEANVSKSNVQEDKNVGAKQAITVHRMTVVKNSKDEEIDDESESS